MKQVYVAYYITLIDIDRLRFFRIKILVFIQKASFRPCYYGNYIVFYLCICVLFIYVQSLEKHQRYVVCDLNDISVQSNSFRLIYDANSWLKFIYLLQAKW